jgi:hypothetical protein
MQRERKTLSVMVRNRKSAKKFQADIKVVDRLGINEIAEQWAESASLKPVMAKTVIGSLEEFILQMLADGKQLDFGLVSFYPRLSAALPSRDSDPAAEGLFVRGAVKARRALCNGLRDKIDAVNSASSIRPRIFSIYDMETKRFDQIAAGHRISAAGRDIPIDPEDPQEGVWIERRTKRGYERMMKAKLLHSDVTRVEFMLDFDLPPRKYMIAVQTRCGRGKDYKTAICRREVFISR